MRLLIALLASLVVTLPVAAQSFQGSWSCRGDQGTRTGLLTIYPPSYGFASRTGGNELSGIGAVTTYEDGVTFDQGPLRQTGNISIGRLVSSPDTGIQLRLESDNAALMFCIPVPT